MLELWFSSAAQQNISSGDMGLGESTNPGCLPTTLGRIGKLRIDKFPDGLKLKANLSNDHFFSLSLLDVSLNGI